MSTEIVLAERAPAAARPPAHSQAEGDEHLIRLWLHGKSVNTRDAYLRDVLQFTEFVDVPLPQLRLEQLQDFADHLEALSLRESTRARKLSAVKSLLSFGQKVGYLVYNVGAAVAAPRVRERLAERILAESAVQRIIALEPEPRNHALLRLFYATGGRVSELCGLKVRDLQPRLDARTGREAGQVTLFGKGRRSRAVLLSPETWADLARLAAGAAPDAPLFRSRRRAGHLSRSQVLRIVRAAALRAGLPQAVSPHWFRHAHASHALDRGAPPHLVRDTLGHASLNTTNRYAHARPDQSSSQFLGI
jgi:integrase/recombinase XerD